MKELLNNISKKINYTEIKMGGQSYFGNLVKLNGFFYLSYITKDGEEIKDFINVDKIDIVRIREKLFTE